MNAEEERQQAKEQAALRALHQGLTLIRRDLEVWGLKTDGTAQCISKSAAYDSLWQDALHALKDTPLNTVKPEMRIGIGLLVFKDGKVLLGKRKGEHLPGVYAGPGGHLEFGETFAECARREAMEETGIQIDNASFLCVTNWRDNDKKHYVDVGLIADWKSGDPRVCEPDKCESWSWFSVVNVPSPLMVFTTNYLEARRTGKVFFES